MLVLQKLKDIRGVEEEGGGKGRGGWGGEGWGKSAETSTRDIPTIVAEVLLYVHRNRRFIRDGSPGRPPRLSHSS